MFPGLPWLADFLDAVASNLPTYSRSRIVDLLEALAALDVKLDASMTPRRKEGKGSGSRPKCAGRLEGQAGGQGSDGELLSWGAAGGSSNSNSQPQDEPSPPAVLPRRTKWLRSVLRTFKSRRQPTARADHLDRLLAALHRLCKGGGDLCFLWWASGLCRLVNFPQMRHLLVFSLLFLTFLCMCKQTRPLVKPGRMLPLPEGQTPCAIRRLIRRCERDTCGSGGEDSTARIRLENLGNVLD